MSGLAAFTGCLPAKVGGALARNWCVVIARASNWSALDADSELERVFSIDLPDNLDSVPELLAFLRSRTVGQIPTARRNALQSRLAALGVDLTGIGLASTWFEVFQRVRRAILGFDPGDGDASV